MITTSVPSPDVLNRLRFQPDIGLLYDPRYGLEHRLDRTGVAFVQASLRDHDPVATLTHRFGVAPVVIDTDLRAFWDRIVTAPAQRHPRRRSGAPTDWAAADVPFPLALEVELTRSCNWHCDFCYNTWKVPDDSGIRPRSDTGTDPGVHIGLDMVAEVIAQAAAGGCLRMRFSGGEPTMHPHYRRIVAMAVHAGLEVELFTNGVRMTATEARRLAGLGLRIALFSVHGLDESHIAMARNPAAATQAWRGLRAAVGAGLITVAETLVCEDNIGEMPQLTQRLMEAGVADVSFMPYVPYGPGDPRRPVLLARLAEVIDECTALTVGLKVSVPCAPRHCLSTTPTPITDPVRTEFDNHCAAGILWASVSYDGRLRHCPHSAVYAGTVDDGLAQVWREQMVPTVRAALAPTGACVGCGQLSACGGGCHLNKVTSYDNPSGGRPLLPLVAVTDNARGCRR